MMIYYGDTFYNHRDLCLHAKEYVKLLPPEVTHLISKGASGCAIASAMLVLTERPLYHLFLRKGEKAHSSCYTGFVPEEKSVSAIVDDFTSSGETVMSILNWDTEYRQSIKYIIADMRGQSGTMEDLLQQYFKKLGGMLNY